MNLAWRRICRCFYYRQYSVDSKGRERSDCDPSGAWTDHHGHADRFIWLVWAGYQTAQCVAAYGSSACYHGRHNSDPGEECQSGEDRQSSGESGMALEIVRDHCRNVYGKPDGCQQPSGRCGRLQILRCLDQFLRWANHTLHPIPDIGQRETDEGQRCLQAMVDVDRRLVRGSVCRR